MKYSFVPNSICVGLVQRQTTRKDLFKNRLQFVNKVSQNILLFNSVVSNPVKEEENRILYEYINRKVFK